MNPGPGLASRILVCHSLFIHLFIRVDDRTTVEVKSKKNATLEPDSNRSSCSSSKL